MQYLIRYVDRQDAGDLRARFLEPHIDSRRALVPNHLLFASPTFSEDGKNIVGGILIVEAADRAQAETIAHADPYVREGLFETVEVTPARISFGALPEGTPGPESVMQNPELFADYTPFYFTAGEWSRKVWKKGSGPAVIIMHEMPNLHPLVMRFADHVAEAGMTVYCPSIIGEDGRGHEDEYLQKQIGVLCVRREFNILADGKSSPIVDWFRALARHAHEECGGRGVGAVGMCLTGGFGLAMMTEPSVVAPVMSQPSMPGGVPEADAMIDVSPEEIACAKRRFKEEDLSVMGLRYKGDKFVPAARFETLRRTFGDRFVSLELEDEIANPTSPLGPHSVLTWDIIDKPGEPSKQVELDVIEFLRMRTHGA